MSQPRPGGSNGDQHGNQRLSGLDCAIRRRRPVNLLFVDTSTTPFDGDAKFACRALDKLAHRVLFAGGDDEVFSMPLLQHHPLYADVILWRAPSRATHRDFQVQKHLSRPTCARAMARVILRVTKVAAQLW